MKKAIMNTGKDIILKLDIKFNQELIRKYDSQKQTNLIGYAIHQSKISKLYKQYIKGL